MSFTTRSAGALEFARFDLIFVPYSHYDETKTLLYPNTSICLMNADGKQLILETFQFVEPLNTARLVVWLVDIQSAVRTLLDQLLHQLDGIKSCFLP